jgi:4-hydroxybenzoate polyprenyltransferase
MVTTRAGAAGPDVRFRVLRAAYIRSWIAVTFIVALLATDQGVSGKKAVVVIAAIFTGQLTIGWGNDLLDASRDHQVGRRDKPLANGMLPPSAVLRCVAVAVAVRIGLSLLAGWRSRLTHLALGVASGHLYNYYFKATRWSWFPYAVAFSSLPAVVTLADTPATAPPGRVTSCRCPPVAGAHRRAGSCWPATPPDW